MGAAMAAPIARAGIVSLLIMVGGRIVYAADPFAGDEDKPPAP